MSEHGHLFDEVRRIVQAGRSKKDLFDAVKTMTADPNTASIAGKLRGYAAKLWNQAEFEEKSWRGVSTNDRIDKAFEFLEQAGIFAAQDYWCCSSCGHSAAAEAMTERKTRGYVFYHQQDTERGVEGEGLMLAYGSYEGEDEKTVAIAREICAALDRFGVPHEWNGSPMTRIFVEPFEWRKRRATTVPPIPPGERGKVLSRKPRDDSGGDASTEEAAPKTPEFDARLTHPDGRVWMARMGDGALELRIRDAEGDEFNRVVKSKNPRADLESRIAELQAEGFSVAGD
ncbi:MAG: hypothetical protein IPM54_02560 [Polyangiaceae bacterium]|nr:hypothetical protein [Polyangiaceae bacterium]